MSSVRRYPTIQASAPTVMSQTPMINSGRSLTQNVPKLSAAAQSILTQMTQGQPQTLEVIPSTLTSRQQARSLQSQVQQLTQQQHLTPLEVEKVKALSATSVYLSSDVTPLKPMVAKLAAATSIAVVQQISQQLTQTLEGQQQQLTVDRLVIACNQAALKVGFEPLQAAVKVMPNQTVRLVANDSTGRSLITEVAIAPDRDVALATEIIGTNDHTCDEILNAFEAALQEEGIIFSAPERKFTGGICELEAAKDFVRNYPTLTPPQRSTPKSTTPSRSQATPQIQKFTN